MLPFARISLELRFKQSRRSCPIILIGVESEFNLMNICFLC
jgi:hypothetical protein